MEKKVVEMDSPEELAAYRVKRLQRQADLMQKMITMNRMKSRYWKFWIRICSDMHISLLYQRKQVKLLLMKLL